MRLVSPQSCVQYMTRWMAFSAGMVMASATSEFSGLVRFISSATCSCVAAFTPPVLLARRSRPGKAPRCLSLSQPLSRSLSHAAPLALALA